jgi:hypothetical protein
MNQESEYDPKPPRVSTQSTRHREISRHQKINQINNLDSYHVGKIEDKTTRILNNLETIKSNGEDV